jgi:hypothetical protein
MSTARNFLALAGGASMRKLSKHTPRLFLIAILCLSVTDVSSRGQDPELAFDQIVAQPRGLPQLPPQGAWGEVINVTSRWIVIQNHSGQQYPIAADDVGEFLIRWPTSVATSVPTWSKSSMWTCSRGRIEHLLHPPTTLCFPITPW